MNWITKMRTQYLIRLDDACQTMNRIKWQRMEDILDKYGIKPMVGVIPHNEDAVQKIDPVDDSFWGRVKSWEKKGWAIALHGYSHCYTSTGGKKGINPMWDRSEFAGLPLEEQKEKIRGGVAIMRENGINPKYFFAPSHTFDMNTLEALMCESDIRIISDTIGRYPYKMGEFWFTPQISGRCIKMPVSGFYTICFHPSTMEENAFRAVDRFIGENQEHFIGFQEIKLSEFGNKKTIDKFISWAFFAFRRLRGLQ